MPDILARGGLQIKVCVRTYRLFFVSRSEDIMVRVSSRQERIGARKAVESRNEKRRKWLEDYASVHVKDEPQSATAEVAPKPPPVPSSQSLVPSGSAPQTPVEAVPPVVTKDVEMEIAKEKKLEGTVHTAPQDDPVEAAVAIAAVGPAPEPDPEDITMDNTALTPQLVSREASGLASITPAAPEPSRGTEDAVIPSPTPVPSAPTSDSLPVGSLTPATTSALPLAPPEASSTVRRPSSASKSPAQRGPTTSELEPAATPVAATASALGTHRPPRGEVHASKLAAAPATESALPSVPMPLAQAFTTAAPDSRLEGSAPHPPTSSEPVPLPNVPERDPPSEAPPTSSSS